MEVGESLQAIFGVNDYVQKYDKKGYHGAFCPYMRLGICI